MAVYVVGDVQGCYDPLRRLLERVSFEPGPDRLWLAGDLVNRGPASLAVLRFVRELGTAADCVLGNHDLHLLALAHGARPVRRKDTFAEILAAPDRDELLGWLASRPLLHRDRDLGFTLVHAGLPPQWSLGQAESAAAELGAVIGSERAGDYFAHMYGDEPRRWDDALAGWPRLRFITNALTRMRFCTPDGSLDLESSGAPGTQPAGLVPWYAAEGRRSRGELIVFGHWAALDLRPGDARRYDVYHVDTGCVWGGRLSALRVPDLRVTSVSCS